MDHPDYERGLRNRRAMLGDAWVDRSAAQANAMSQAMAERIPGAKLLVMPGVAHLSALEQPAAFGSHVEDFLSNPHLARWTP